MTCLTFALLYFSLAAKSVQVKPKTKQFQSKTHLLSHFVVVFLYCMYHIPTMNQPTPPRKAVIDILCAWENSGKPVDLFFTREATSLAHHDRAMVKTILYGVLRQRDYLDHIIGRFSSHPLSKMKPLTLNTLRVGVFQLLLLDRIPESAAVNETVRALKKARQPQWLVRFVNGVLRNVARQKQKLPAPNDLDHGAESILNHPKWLHERWLNHFGRDTMVQICRCNNQEPPLTLKVNSGQTDRTSFSKLLTAAGIQHRPGRYSPDSLVITGHSGPVDRLPGYDQGLFQVQDEAAQLATLLFPPFSKGQRILDGCAGLGGKTSNLAQMLTNGNHLIAVEPDARRCRLLRDNLKRLRLDHKVDIRETNLQRFAQSAPELFEAILIDAPCSGTGVIRRQPDIRWNRQQRDLQGYQALQIDLLVQAASLLLPGGRLVYATCSLEQEENQEVIEAFIRLQPAFRVVSAVALLPEAADELVDHTGYFRSHPANGLDGFFGCALSS